MIDTLIKYPSTTGVILDVECFFSRRGDTEIGAIESLWNKRRVW